MRYEPGNLLKEYTLNSVSQDKTLVGSFLIVSITQAGVHTVTIYDSDGFWNPRLALFSLTLIYGIGACGHGKFNDCVEEEGETGRYDIRI